MGPCGVRTDTLTRSRLVPFPVLSSCFPSQRRLPQILHHRDVCTAPPRNPYRPAVPTAHLARLWGRRHLSPPAGPVRRRVRAVRGEEPVERAGRSNPSACVPGAPGRVRQEPALLLRRPWISRGWQRMPCFQKPRRSMRHKTHCVHFLTYTYNPSTRPKHP